MESVVEPRIEREMLLDGEEEVAGKLEGCDLVETMLSSLE